MDEDFKYRYITKLPWLYATIWTAIGTWFIWRRPFESYWSGLLPMFVYGIVWWFQFQFADERASRYRRKVLFKTPELKAEFIRQQLAEWEAEADE